MKKDGIVNKSMDGIIFLAFVGSLVHSLFISLYLTIPFYRTLLAVLIAFLILSLLFWRLRVTLPLSLILLVSIWFLYRPIPEEWYQWARGFLRWSILYPQGRIPYDEAYILPFFYLSVGVLSLIFYILLFKVPWPVISVVSGVALLGVEWFLGHTQIAPYIWGFALSIILLMSARNHKKLWRDKGSPSRGQWLLNTLPLALVIVITSIIITPKDTHRLKWKALEDLTEKIREKHYSYSNFTGSRKPFRLSSTGFSGPDNELGGPVKLEDDIVLEAKSPFPAYLRGSVLNHYTGTSWIDTTNDKRYRLTDRTWEGVRNRAFDLDEDVWSSDLLFEHHSKDRLLLPHYLTLRHRGIHTGVIFNVQYTKDIRPEKKGSFLPYFNNKGETFTSRDIGEDETYTLEVLYIMPDDELLRKLIDDYISKPLDEPMIIEDITKWEYIGKHYTHLPDNLPTEIGDLALSIVENGDSPYEKATKLRDYLKESYSYSLDPPHTPPDRDFVEYFLFDLEEGYCTYFATAMAVMGRTLGLPTRYIEGFAMPQDPNRDGIYEIRKSHAHAWTEIYFRGLGWIPFDPTPASRDISQAEQSNVAPSYPDYWMEYSDELDDQRTDMDYSLVPNEEHIGNISEKMPMSLLILIIAASVGFLATISIILYWYITAKLIPKSYVGSQAVLFYYNRILWLLTLYGFPPYPGETPYAYGKRVDTWLINEKSNMTKITEILIESQFASREPEDSDIAIIKGLYEDIERDITDIIGRVHYLYQYIKTCHPFK